MVGVKESIRAGNLEQVKARLQPFRCDDNCAWAAYWGHLHILQWLHAQDPNCKYARGICSYAAPNGHLHVLQWARAQVPPFPWSETTCTWATFSAHFHFLKWARAQVPPCPWRPADRRLFIAQNKRYRVFKWLRESEHVELDPNVLQWMAQVDEAVAQVSTSSDIHSLVKEFVDM